MAIAYPTSPLPEISISPAPYLEPVAEPYSPFSTMTPIVHDDEHTYRSSLLHLPSPGSAKWASLSPLRPEDAPVKGNGLERERFEVMLRASRERNASVGARKSVDLRKEVALKVHKYKQLERRAIFLSKIKAAPCPKATNEPKTPPESPAILHFSLPSPGLNSPLAMFEALAAEKSSGLTNEKRAEWVECVEFNVSGGPRRRKLALAPRKQLPSLDQITARLGASAASTRPPAASPVISRRLPAFLQKNAPSVVAETPKPSRLPGFLKAEAVQHRRIKSADLGEAEPQEAKPVMKTRPPLPASVGRLHMPVRISPEAEKRVETRIAFPSEVTPCPSLEIKTTVIVGSNRVGSPDMFTESNLVAFNSRSRTAQDMLSTLRRRSYGAGAGLDELASRANAMRTTGNPSSPFIPHERHWRRWSAPAELIRIERREFAHSVLALPGGF